MPNKPDLVKAVRRVATQAMTHPDHDEEAYNAATILLYRLSAWESSEATYGPEAEQVLQALGDLKVNQGDEGIVRTLRATLQAGVA